MNALKSDFVEKFKLSQLIIKSVGVWLISLRPEQPTIGSLVITLNRYCARLSDITEEEGLDLALAFKETERLLESTFQPDKINYLALMMVDEQVHFHVIPRYENLRILQGEKYFDKTWPGLPSLEAGVRSESEIEQILHAFKALI